MPHMDRDHITMGLRLSDAMREGAAAMRQHGASMEKAASDLGGTVREAEWVFGIGIVIWLLVRLFSGKPS